MYVFDYCLCVVSCLGECVELCFCVGGVVEYGVDDWCCYCVVGVVVIVFEVGYCVGVGGVVVVGDVVEVDIVFVVGIY